MICKHQLFTMAAGVGCVLALGSSALAQGNRSAWMWTSSGHTYGAGNIVDDYAKAGGVINDFEAWNFDRIYTSLSNWPVTQPEIVAHWNANLDDAGMDSQMLLGEPTWLLPGTRPGLLNIIQTRLIDYNTSRSDPREWIDGVHLDIEPHQLSQWGSGTSTDKRDLLLMLGDTYAEVRALLDSSGQTQVEIYADLPVWFDSSSQIAWDPGERDQWFDDIGQSLTGITMMAYERSTLSHINNGVQWEIDNFNGEVRIGLESNSIGAGKTWPTFQALLDMADALDAYHGANIGGIDFHPLTTFADQAGFSFLPGDVNGDGFVGLADLDVLLNNWNQNVEIGNWGQGDLGGTGDGFIGLSDLDVILNNWNAGMPPSGAGAVVPEPASLLMLGLGGLGLGSRGRRKLIDAVR